MMHPTDPPLPWHALRLPKHGHTDAECEDAWAADPARGCFAIADGASECAYAGLWAQLLVESLIASARPIDLATWLDGPRRRWSEEVMGLELPWYLEEKRKEGAFAALLGLSVWPATRNRLCLWRATVVGDCSLIRVRPEGQVRAFPYEQSSDFGSDPRLIGSRVGVVPESAHCFGSLIPGDRLFLMTDALAQWFLQTHENGQRPWEAIAAVMSAEQPEVAFATWIEELRTDGDLRDDDVTLLMLTTPMPEESPP